MGTAAGQRRPHILQYPAPAKRSITKFLVYTHVQGVYRNQGQTHQVREGQTGIITIIRKSPYNANYTSDTRPAWTGSYSISPRKQNFFPLRQNKHSQAGCACLVWIRMTGKVKQQQKEPPAWPAALFVCCVLFTNYVW